MGDSAAFRGFVMDDCTRLMSSLFTLIDEVAFAPLRQRLAQRLLADADPRGVATVTHQKLADEVGSVREVVSRKRGHRRRRQRQLGDLQPGHWLGNLRRPAIQVVTVGDTARGPS